MKQRERNRERETETNRETNRERQRQRQRERDERSSLPSRNLLCISIDMLQIGALVLLGRLVEAHGGKYVYLEVNIVDSMSDMFTPVTHFILLEAGPPALCEAELTAERLGNISCL